MNGDVHARPCAALRFGAWRFFAASLRLGSPLGRAVGGVHRLGPRRSSMPIGRTVSRMISSASCSLPLALEQLARRLVRQDHQDRVADRRHVGLHLVGEERAVDLEHDADLRVAVGVLVGEVDDERLERQEGRRMRRVGLRRLVGAARDVVVAGVLGARARPCFFSSSSAPAAGDGQQRSAATTPITISFFLPCLDGHGGLGVAVAAAAADIEDSFRAWGARPPPARRRAWHEGNYRNRGSAPKPG